MPEPFACHVCRAPAHLLIEFHLDVEQARAELDIETTMPVRVKAPVCAECQRRCASDHTLWRLVERLVLLRRRIRQRLDHPTPRGPAICS